MIDEQDMTDLIYIYDAYNVINKALFGSEMALGFNEGNFGTLSRVSRVIERNAAEELKKNDGDELCEILQDTSRTPEERAKLLLMK